MVDKRVPIKGVKAKSFWRAFNDRLPFVGAMVLTAVVTIWVGLTLNFLFTSRKTVTPVLPQPSLPKNSLTPAAAPIPPWFQQATPLPDASLPTPTLPSKTVQSNPASSATVPQNLPAPANATNPPAGFPLPQARYGHLPYLEADPAQLVEIGTYGTGADQRTESLDQDAAAAFTKMVAAAAVEGVRIIPISGFRTVADQEKLFQRQIRRQGIEAAAAQLSAPPGYSEHHTGYAIDVGDGTQPSADLKFAFEETTAYQWMQQNAGRFGFELSFPRDNPQGVSFEPWHWRYVSSRRANAIFKVAHSLQGR